MTIIEQSLIAKNPKGKGEDGIVVTRDFVAVIDGSTSKSTVRCHHDPAFINVPSAAFPWPRRHSNGELAMLITANYIKKMRKDTTCNQFCSGVTASVRSYYKKELLSHLAAHPEDRLTASVILFSRLRREIWMVGDCQALVTPVKQTAESLQGALFLDNPKPYEQELAALRSKEAQRLLAAGTTIDELLEHDVARDAIIPRMVETMKHQNNGYSVVDGFPIDKHHIRIIPLDFQPWEVVLASDGYPFLCRTLEESERRLSLQRDKDPLNIGPEFMATKAFRPGFNSFDDRAYIRFLV